MMPDISFVMSRIQSKCYKDVSDELLATQNTFVNENAIVLNLINRSKSI